MRTSSSVGSSSPCSFSSSLFFSISSSSEVFLFISAVALSLDSSSFNSTLFIISSEGVIISLMVLAFSLVFLFCLWYHNNDSDNKYSNRDRLKFRRICVLRLLACFQIGGDLCFACRANISFSVCKTVFLIRLLGCLLHIQRIRRILLITIINKRQIYSRIFRLNT